MNLGHEPPLVPRDRPETHVCEHDEITWEFIEWNQPWDATYHGTCDRCESQFSGTANNGYAEAVEPIDLVEVGHCPEGCSMIDYDTHGLIVEWTCEELGPMDGL